MLSDATFSAIFDGLRDNSKLPDAFAGYFWGGFDVPNALVPGLIRLQQAGFMSTARIILNAKDVRPKSETDRGLYRFDEQWEAEVPADIPFLPAAVRSTQYQQAFALPGLRTFVFTAYDSASRNHRFDPIWLSANAELVRTEYRDMTVALYETQNGTGKQFIILNWESDSNIFAEGHTAQDSERVLTALTLWFRLRQEGIRQGRKIATAQGWREVEVNDGIEFNNIRFQQEYRQCFPGGFRGDALHNIIKSVKPDYASYSAWESTGRCRLYDDLIIVKQFLHAQTNGHTQLIVGELGVPEHSRFSLFPSLESLHTKAWRFAQLAHAAVRANIPIIILWKAWDDFVHKGEGNGLLHSNGSARPALNYLKMSLAASDVVGQSNTMIGGVVDQFDMNDQRNQDGRRYFEVFGRFPEAKPGNIFSDPGWVGNYQALVTFAEGEIIAVNTTGESESQVNFALRPHNINVRWFLLRLRHKERKHGIRLTSNEFGPVRLNRIPPLTSDCKTRVTNRYWDHWGF